jgi:hypothetical protein
MRARALQLLARIPGRESQYVNAALRDSDDDIRITGIRIARELGMDVIPIARSLANDPSMQVLRECAVALRHSKSSDAPAIWAQLALHYHGKDRWYLEALGIAADKNWDACLDAYFAANGGIWNSTSARDIVWRSRGKKTPEMLVRIIKDSSTTSGEKPHYMRSMDFQTGPEKESALLQLISVN